MSSLFQAMFRRYLYRREYRRKQKADKKLLRRHQQVMRDKIKSEYRQERALNRKKFLANPFAGKEITEDMLVRREFKQLIRQQKKETRTKWWIKFRHNPFRTLFIKEKNEEVQQMERWRKVDKKIAFRKRVRNIFLTLSEIIHSPELRGKFIKGALQSATYFILAFLLVYIIYQLVTIGVSRIFNVPTIWYYYRVKFPLFTGSPLYTRAALISIFASGPLASLILSFVFLKQYFSKKTRSQNLKMFYLWGFICGANLFFGSYIVGFITRTEFIYVTEWIFMSTMFDVEEIIFAIISISISLLIGRLVTPLFLLATGSPRLIEPNYRLHYIVTHIFIPWAIGVTVFFVITMPTHYFPLFLKTVTPIFLLIPSVFTYNSTRNESIHVTGVVRKSYFKWSVIIAVIAILFFYRIILNFGLQFF